MESRHSGTQTRNGKNWKIGIGCILTSTSFRFGWRVHLASDLLVIFSHSPVRPRSFPVLLFPFWVPYFPMIFHFFCKCFREFVLFPGWRPLRAEVKSPHAMEKKWETTTNSECLSRVVLFLNQSSLMPWPWQFLVCFRLISFCCFSHVWFRFFFVFCLFPGLVPLFVHSFSVFIFRGFS